MKLELYDEMLIHSILEIDEMRLTLKLPFEVQTSFLTSQGGGSETGARPYLGIYFDNDEYQIRARKNARRKHG